MAAVIPVIKAIYYQYFMVFRRMSRRLLRMPGYELPEAIKLPKKTGNFLITM